MSCLLFILAVYHLYFISAQLMWSTYNLVVRVQWQQRASLFYSLTHTPCWPLSHRATCSIACVVPPFPCPKLLQHWMWHADTRRDMLLCKAEAIETLHFQFSSKFRKKNKKIPTRPRSPFNLKFISTKPQVRRGKLISGNHAFIPKNTSRLM